MRNVAEPGPPLVVRPEVLAIGIEEYGSDRNIPITSLLSSLGLP